MFNWAMILTFVLCVNATANGFSQESKINMDLKGVRLKKAFSLLEEKGNIRILYSEEDLPKDHAVSLQVKETPVLEVLKMLLKDTYLNYQVLKDGLVIITTAEMNLISDPTVKGVVTDDQGAPLTGVNITVKGTNRGTTTDAAGKFSIDVPSNGILVFSFVGFVAQEVRPGDQASLSIRLVPENKILNDVVVLGYGSQKRKDLVGAVGVASRKDFGDVAVSNTTQLIQGKIAGVQVLNNSGEPGAGTQIVVRGTGSFTDASPLYVIDGIQSDVATFNALSPFDIQDITVLKDASSVAIYGAQGANGVVIITTRHPKISKPKISYDGYVGFSRPWRQFHMLNAAQYTDLVKEWYVNYGQPLPPRLSTPEALITKTDWQKEMFRTGRITEHHINLAGASENVAYSFSFGYTKQEGQVVDQSYQRANIRINLDEHVGKRLKFGQQVNFSSQLQKGVSADILNGLRMPPYISVYDSTNVLGGYGIATSALDGNDAQNPLIQPHLRDVKNRSLNGYLQLYGEVDLLEGLKFRSQFGGTFLFNQSYNYNPTYAGNQLVTQDQIKENYSYGLSYIFENYFTYVHRFGMHDINVTAGNSYRDGGLGRSIGLVGSNFATDDIHQIGVAKTVTFSSGSANSNARFISYFARLNYIFLDKYILTGTIRQDATSLFSKANRVGYFPSVGLGWKLYNEPFIRKISFLSDLKLRATWGRTGNSNISGFSYQSNVWTGSGNSVVYPLGPDEVLFNGSTIAVPATPHLKWETTSTTDVGLDAALFKNKLTLSIEYYHRNNQNLLVSVPLALSTGYGGVAGASNSQLINAASAYNKGFELSLGYNGKLRDLNYSLNANVAYNKNSVTSLGTQGAAPIISGAFYEVPSMTRTQPGQPIGSFYGYVYDHVAIDQTDIDKYNTIARQKTGDPTVEYQSGLLPGDRIFADVNGDGVVTEADKKFLGSPIPKWNYGFNLTMSYRNFDMMVALQGVADVQLINAMKYYIEGVALPFNAKTTVLKRWQHPGDITDIARAGQNYGTAANLRNSSWFVENGAYARIRNVTLGYTIPVASLGASAGKVFTSIRCYVTAQNLFTFTKYSGYDPEVSGGAGNLIFSRGIDQGAVPQPRTFLLGLQIGF